MKAKADPETERRRNALASVAGRPHGAQYAGMLSTGCAAKHFYERAIWLRRSLGHLELDKQRHEHVRLHAEYVSILLMWCTHVH